MTTTPATLKERCKARPGGIVEAPAPDLVAALEAAGPPSAAAAAKTHAELLAGCLKADQRPVSLMADQLLAALGTGSSKKAAPRGRDAQPPAGGD